MIVEAEKEKRLQLGIPEDAPKVLLFTETSHWDPDWLFTSKEYFNIWVKRQLKQAVDELDKDPARIYCVECIFFLKMFFEAMPSYRQKVVNYVNSGNLRLLSSGVTTPDTIVPQDELLLRDYALGLNWLKENGMHQVPEVAFFPDTFGFSPGLPEILNSGGMHSVAICRIDGMFFLGNEFELSSSYPKKNTTAYRLQVEEKSADFIWIGPNDSEVLCRWMAFTYGQGEKLAHSGITRELDVPLAVPARGNSHVTTMIKKYYSSFEKMSRTPYVHCPIGFDFSSPIADLNYLISTYNEISYPKTKIWATVAGLDDYFDLVNFHRDDLPRISIDPSQYFTGFFTSRPTVKNAAKQLATELIATEKIATVVSKDIDDNARQTIKNAWWTIAMSNHHDFITGTATNRVVRKEQLPIITSALNNIRSLYPMLLEKYNQTHNNNSGTGLNNPDKNNQTKKNNVEYLKYQKTLGQTSVEWQNFKVKIDEQIGGNITSIVNSSGDEVLSLSGDISAYFDSGGLWRMGNEYKGGEYRKIDSTRNKNIKTEPIERENRAVGFSSTGTINGHEFKREIFFDEELPIIRFKVTTTLSDRRTATLCLRLKSNTQQITMDTPGGVVKRPFSYRFDPTYWSVQNFFNLEGENSNSISVMFPRSTACTFRIADDLVEASIIISRNAKKEFGFKFLPLPAQPAFGHDPGPHTFYFSIYLHENSAWRDTRIPHLAELETQKALLADNAATIFNVSEKIVTVDSDYVKVLAFKNSYDSKGYILRLSSYSKKPEKLLLKIEDVPISSAQEIDSRENKTYKNFKAENGAVYLTVKPGLSSFKILATKE
jgi:alpha-mannosidase